MLFDVQKMCEYLTSVVSSRYVSLSLHNDFLQLKIVKVNILHHAIRQESGFRSFGFSTHAHILWRQGDNLAFLTK